MPSVDALEAQLNDFSLERRLDALNQLRALAAAGAVQVEPPGCRVNLHAHTFFSFNGYGYSPCRFAWEGYKLGLEVAGIVDFDVLDGASEMLQAGDILGLKTIVGLETRVFFPEYAQAEITSPGEPGITYFMGTGFVAAPPADTQAGATLADMRRRARERNVGMMTRINAALGPVQIDYDADAIPLTPQGNATERHLLEAYTRKADVVFASDRDKIAAFWAERLAVAPDQIASLIDDQPKLHELIRKRLMKAGGVGYVKPDAGSFPALDEVIAMVQACGAIPTQTWLDGLSEGERDMREQLRILMNKGVAALNVIPDRNWNIADPEEKRKKVAKLGEVVAIAEELGLPLVVGTELNKFGQKTVDTFEAAELAPYTDAFLRGARILWAHTVLRRAGKFGYVGERADAIFGNDLDARNAFFAKVGEMKPGGDITAQTKLACRGLPAGIAAKAAS